MGQRRAERIMSKFSRLHPAEHRATARDAGRVEREARLSDSPYLPEHCLALFAALSAAPLSAAYIAQSVPALLPALLSRAAALPACDWAALRLAALLVRSGASAESAAAGVKGRVEAFAALIAIGDSGGETAAAQAALVVLTAAACLSADGDAIAARLATDDALGLWDTLDTQEAIAAAATTTTATATATAAAALLVPLRVLMAECAAACPPGVLRDAAMKRLRAACGVQCAARAVSMAAALDALQRNRFDPAARLEALHAVSAQLLLCPQEKEEKEEKEEEGSGPMTREGTGTGGVGALCALRALRAVAAAASDVDERLCAAACRTAALCLSQCDPRGETTNTTAAPHAIGVALAQLGMPALLEDLLEDYSARVVSASLRLAALLAAVVPEAMAASRSAEAVAGVVIAMARRNTQWAQSQSQSQSQSQLRRRRKALSSGTALSIAALRALAAVDCAAVPEEALAAAMAIAANSLERREVAAALRALVAMAAAHPAAAAGAVDLEFVAAAMARSPNRTNAITNAIIHSNTNSNTHFTTNSRSSRQGAERALLAGSLDVCAAAIARQPSCVTLEWMETLAAGAAAIARNEWSGDLLFGRALWAAVLQTIDVSEDGCAFLFDDEGFAIAVAGAIGDCCRASDAGDTESRTAQSTGQSAGKEIKEIKEKEENEEKEEKEEKETCSGHQDDPVMDRASEECPRQDSAEQEESQKEEEENEEEEEEEEEAEEDEEEEKEKEEDEEEEEEEEEGQDILPLLLCVASSCPADCPASRSALSAALDAFATAPNGPQVLCAAARRAIARCAPAFGSDAAADFAAAVVLPRRVMDPVLAELCAHKEFRRRMEASHRDVYKEALRRAAAESGGCEEVRALMRQCLMEAEEMEEGERGIG